MRATMEQRMSVKFFLAAILGIVWIFLTGCGPSKEAKVRDGVTFAKACLQLVGVNPLATAAYQGYVRNGQGPAAYVKASLPKKDPPFDSFEDDKPGHTYTVVIRPSGAPNEWSIEGYGLDLKKPLTVEYITISLPEDE